jgi:hypothetical protein
MSTPMVMFFLNVGRGIKDFRPPDDRLDGFPLSANSSSRSVRMSSRSRSVEEISSCLAKAALPYKEFAPAVFISGFKTPSSREKKTGFRN